MASIKGKEEIYTSAIMSGNRGQMMGFKESFTKSKASTTLHSKLEQDFTQHEHFRFTDLHIYAIIATKIF